MGDDKERLDWIEKAATENLRFRLQNAEALAREASGLLPVLLGGIGAALAYTIRGLEAGPLEPLALGVAAVAGWLMLAALVLLVKCIMSRELPALGNHVGNLWQPTRDFESLRKGELNGIQARIDAALLRNCAVAWWLDRVRLMAAATPAVFLAVWFLVR